MTAPSTPTRWALTRNVARPPYFTARAGTVGTIVGISDVIVVLRLDEPIDRLWNTLAFKTKDDPAHHSPLAALRHYAIPVIEPRIPVDGLLHRARQAARVAYFTDDPYLGDQQNRQADRTADAAIRYVLENLHATDDQILDLLDRLE